MNNSNSTEYTLSGFVPMKRNKNAKEREPNKQHVDSKGKKWQRNDNKRNYEHG